jgi:hypothetical protein
MRILVSLAAAAIAALTTPPATLAQAPAHDKAFWLELAAKRFAVPEGESVTALARELSGLLASPDPELRDDVAYSGLASWIYRERRLPPDVLRSLTDEWMANLSAGAGERGADTVFRRSFSALSLGLIAALDNAAPFLERPEFDRLLEAGLAYLAAERDVRGFDETKGWMHSVAHTADLLRFLARSRHLQPAQQGAILSAIAAKLGRVDEVLTHGEDERLARAVVSIVARTDFDREAFAAWLTSLAPARPARPPTAASLAAAQNRRNLVVSLHAVLTTDPRDAPGVQAAREIVRAALKQFVA